MKKVLILHGYTTEYRVPLFMVLNRILKQKGITLEVIIGQASKYEKFASIENLPFFKKVSNRYFYLGKRHLVWEPVLSYLRGCDLIIMRQAAKHLTNWPVFCYAKMTGVKTAYWGNMKAYMGRSNRRCIERLLLKRVDHWFAYNDLTKRIVCSMGYPEDKVTSVQNAIDTKAEREIYNSIVDTEVSQLRRQYGIASGDPVGIFCSRLYADKKLGFLTEAVARIRERVPGFHFFVIGDGVDAGIVRDFTARSGDWFHWVGSQYGKDKIKYFKLAQFQLIPGAVGLHIVDSFAMETPIVTTNNDTHGVEVNYLINGANGVMAPNSMEEYVGAAVKVATNSEFRERLFAGCREATGKYTIENMALNFADGIYKALSI